MCARACAAGLEHRVEFRCEDVTASDLTAATVVYMYLLPRGIDVLRPRLCALRPGTRVASYIFKVPFWEPAAAAAADGAGRGAGALVDTVSLTKAGREESTGSHSRLRIYCAGPPLVRSAGVLATSLHAIASLCGSPISCAPPEPCLAYLPHSHDVLNGTWV